MCDSMPGASLAGVVWAVVSHALERVVNDLAGHVAT